MGIKRRKEAGEFEIRVKLPFLSFFEGGLNIRKYLHIFKENYPFSVLLILVIIFFSPFIFSGCYHLEADFLKWFYPWRFNAVGENPQTSIFLKNDLLHDPVVIHFPQDCLFNGMLKKGALLLWNPYNFCGHPIQAIGHPSMVYPLRIIFHFFFTPLVARELLLMVHLYLAGLFMYLYLRNLSLSRFASLSGGILWMLGGFAIVYLQFENVTMLSAHIPLALYLVEKYALTSKIIHGALLSLTIGSAILTGHWQYVTYAMILIGSYILYRCIEIWRESGRATFLKIAIVFAISLAVGLSVAAVQILPSLELFSYCQRPSFPLSVLFSSNRFLPENLLTLLHPDLLGHPSHHFYFTRMQSGTQNYLDLCGFMGVLTLALAAYGASGRNRMASFFLIFGLLSLLYAMGAPIISLLYYIIPGFKNFVPCRTIFLYTFCIAALGAFGIDRIEKEGISSRVAGFFLLFWLLFSLSIILFCQNLHVNEKFLKNMLMHYVPGGLFQMPNYCDDKGAHALSIVASVLSHFRPIEPFIFLPLILGFCGFLVIYLKSLGRISNNWFKLSLCTLIAIDLLYFGMKFNSTFPREEIYPATEGTTYLRKEGGDMYRVAGLSKMAHPDSLLYYGIYDVAGYAGMFPSRYAKLMTALAGDSPQPYLMADLGEGKEYHAGMADFLNVKHHYTDPLRHLSQDRGDLAYDHDIRIYENRGALPRFFLVPGATVENDPDKILSSITSKSFDPLRTVYIEEKPETPGSREVKGNITIVKYAPGESHLKVENREPAFLVNSECHYAGWEAFIDGKETRIYRANYCFKAIALPPGKHEVLLRFNPGTFRAGLITSITSLILCIAVSCISKMRRGSI